MHLWGFLPWGELCHLHVTNLKSKAQKGFFFPVSFWMTPMPELQNPLSGLSVSGWLLTPGQPIQTPTHIHGLDSTFSNFVSMPPLVWSICSPLSWASGAVTPDYNTWLTLYSKLSSFLQRKKFSLTKSCSPPIIFILKVESWNFTPLEEIGLGEFYRSICVYVFAMPCHRHRGVSHLLKSVATRLCFDRMGVRNPQVSLADT